MQRPLIESLLAPVRLKSYVVNQLTFLALLLKTGVVCLYGVLTLNIRNRLGYRDTVASLQDRQPYHTEGK